MFFCVLTTPSQVSFHFHLPPLTLFYLPSPFTSGNHQALVCVDEFWGVFFFSFINLFTFLTTTPNTPPLWQLSILFSISLKLTSQATEGIISTTHWKISSWNDTSYMPWRTYSECSVTVFPWHIHIESTTKGELNPRIEVYESGNNGRE